MGKESKYIFINGEKIGSLEYVAKACNSYKDLLEALKIANNALCQASFAMQGEGDTDYAIDKVRAAIKKAESD
jgi:hypothetical protein